MMIRDYRELRVYQVAFEAAVALFEASKAWPKEERYALTDQARRSSRAVCANVAEAWAKRRYPRHFVAKLTDADGEAAETETWIAFAVRCGYLGEAEAEALCGSLRQVRGGLGRMMASPEQWCALAGHIGHLREPETAYDTAPQHPDHEAVSSDRENDPA